VIITEIGDEKGFVPRRKFCSEQIGTSYKQLHHFLPILKYRKEIFSQRV